ncbi:nuclear transport factor 2 family protein [Aquimarina sp. 2201CG5-10]|uniref:nuclear transport factor 2 family protein n=1 Tax=Aquimarina callyspongiae TaxID=3098150 RepID=UPI002AB4F6F8|nr:nuclear transport factor 2 family protein [Aquimarina sp. 2201CG5-10]MDY8136041.1 nuclear transport factor 2 family protein [Aquimarina sp. 2201CG5-10]
MNLIKSKILRTRIIYAISLTCFFGVAQTNTKYSKTINTNLFEEISKMDSLLFSAYNNLEVDSYKSLISDDIEFYHDKNGLIDSKKRIVESFKKIVEKKKNASYSITRKLIKNTLEVYEIPGMGAMETGIHQFIETSGDSKISITQAKFMHLWKKQNQNWVIAKVFSYDHQPVKEKVNPNMKTISLTHKQMDVYIGEYQFAPEFVLSIIREGHKMFGLAQGDKIEILPYNLHKFLITRDNSKLEFLVNDKGIVIGIEMQTKKGIMKAKKINNK